MKTQWMTLAAALLLAGAAAAQQGAGTTPGGASDPGNTSALPGSPTTGQAGDATGGNAGGTLNNQPNRDTGVTRSSNRSAESQRRAERRRRAGTGAPLPYPGAGGTTTSPTSGGARPMEGATGTGATQGPQGGTTGTGGAP